MEIDCKKAVFFKENPCYHFSLYPNTSYEVKWRFNCNFRKSNSQLESQPPAAIIDNFGHKETLYLLQWKILQDSIKLYIRSLQKESWVRIKMNLFPDFLAISKGTIFLIGGQQLFIFSTKELRTDRISLIPRQIVSVHPWVYNCQLPNSKNCEYEPGVYVLYKRQNGNYISGQFSVNKSSVKEQSLPAKISKLFKNKQTCTHIEVIIPNLLGIAFLSNQKVCVYNLTTFQSLPSTQASFPISLKKQDKPVFKWKKTHLQGYNDSFFILIGFGSDIFSFYLMVNYSAEAKDHGLEHEPLTSFINTDIIDWQTVSLKPYLTFVLECKHLVDLAISTKGMVYQAKKSHSDLLGECKYIDLMSLLNEYPIVTQECTIWKLYYEDRKEGFITDHNRLLVPNRYPPEMVLYIDKQQLGAQSPNELALNIWRNRYQFSAFLTFEEELLIVRRGSISVFRHIPKDLFDREYLTQSQLQVIETQALESGFLQEKEWKDDFSDPALNVTESRPLIWERQYHVLTQNSQQTEDYLQIRLRNEQSQTIMNQLQDILMQSHKQVYRSLTIPNFQFQLICQELKNKFNYYNLVLNNTAYYLREDERERQFNKLYEKNSLVAKVIDYFYNSYYRSAEFVGIFGFSIVDLFVHQQINQLSDDIDASVFIIMQMMLINLTPKELENQDSSLILPEVKDDYRLFNNPFLDFLIEILKKAVEEENSQTVLLMRKEFSQVVRIGFFDQRSIFFNNLWRNISLFQVLLLSLESETVEKVFLESLLFSLKAKQVHLQYKKIKSYMPVENVSLIEKHLFLNLSKHDLKCDINYIKPQFELQKDTPEHIAEKYIQVKKELIDLEAATSTTFGKEDNLIDIRELFDQLRSSNTFQEQIFNRIKKTIENASLPRIQDKLEFQEKILELLVTLFNDFISKESQTRTQDFGEQEHSILRYNLQLILNCIQEHFNIYKYCFQEEYGKTEAKTFEQTVQVEEDMMEQSFIDHPMRLINNETGFALSQLSLQLVHMALSSDQFHIHQTQNLLCFWLQHIKDLPESEIAFAFFYLCKVGSLDVMISIMKQLNYGEGVIQDLLRGFKEHNQELIRNIIGDINVMDII